MKYKKLSKDVIIHPKKRSSDAGTDLAGHSVDVIRSANNPNIIEEFIINTAIAVEIPQGYFGMLVPRSSTNRKMRMINNVGIIDSGYRGEIRARFQFLEPTTEIEAQSYFKFEIIGYRVLQLVIVPYFDITLTEEVSELDNSDRQDGGFGSTGR